MTDARKTNKELEAEQEREVAEGKPAWNSLRQTEEMFYPTFENAPVAMCLVSPQGRFLSVNAALTRMLEYSKDELLSMSFGDVTHPDDLSASKEWVDTLLAGGEATMDLEKRYIRKSGQVVWGIVRSFLLRGAEGNPLFFITHVQDITERRRSDEAILAERNFANAVLNSLPGIFYMFDQTGKFLRWNRNFEQATGYSPEEIARMSPLDLFLGADRALIEERIGEVFAKGASDAEANLVSKNGKQTPYYFTGQMIHVEGNTCLIGMGIDVTEHRSLEEQLRESQKMEAVGRLAGGIAHDFNNLLTVIIGYGELLLSKIGEGKPMSLEAGEIRKAALKAASLTNQLLAFSRRQILSPEVLDLNGIVTDVEKMLRRIIEEHIDVELNLDEDLWKVKADRNRIEQVIINLAINAKDSMSKGGTLSIGTRNIMIDETTVNIHPDVGPDAYVALSIKDTGHGMDPGTLAHIFEPFFTTKEVGKGTGLGLATVYGIVMQSGGQIHVDSKFGHGTTFTIYLPRVREAASPPKEAAPPGRIASPSYSKTVLLVEDSDTVRELTRNILELTGYDVLEAGSPEDAIRLCESHEGEIHLLLTDVVMPGMSGRDLSDRLRPGRPAMKVLYMSGYTDEAIVDHGILDAGIHFIPKPFSPASMAQKILEVLNSD